MDRDELTKLGKAIDYMHMNYQRQIKVNEIAEYCGLTPRALNAIMSRKFGCTMSVLLRKYRLYQAARLLHFDYIPVEVVAKRCGFKLQYFSNEFKKEFGKTPKEITKDEILPDMPIFKEINGYPLALEYKVTDSVTLEGYPIDVPEGPDTDLMWNAAYGFRHPDGRTDLACKEKTWGIWWYDEEEGAPLQYLMAKEVETEEAADLDRDSNSLPHKVRAEIPGGNYAIFSVSRGKDRFETADNASEMAWHAFHAWQIFSMKETDKWGYTYEVFDEEKVYLYIPVITGFGGVEGEKEFGSHTIDKIIHYIDEHILDDEDLEQNISKLAVHDLFYWDQFRSCYGLRLEEYILRKRLYVLAGNLYLGEITRADLSKKYRFKSFAAYERMFKKTFGVPSNEYYRVNINLLNLDQYYNDNMKLIKMEKVSIEPIRAAGKTVKRRTGRKSMDIDLPQMTAFWLENDLDCYKAAGMQESGKRIAVYHTVPSEEDTPILDYVMGPVLKEGDAYPEEMQEIILEGGRYFMFSFNMKEKEPITLAEQIRCMVRCIDQVWIYKNWLQTDFTSRVCFYCYDGGKIYYYVPMYG